MKIKTVLRLALVGITAITFSTCRPESESSLQPSFNGLSSMQTAAELEIEAAVEKGLTYLASVQETDGRWRYDGGSYPYDLGVTGLVLLTFVDRAKELGLDPFGEDPIGYEYADNVIDGFDFIFNYARSGPNGVYIQGGSSETYDTAIAMAALSATGAPNRPILTGPLNGWTYGDALEGMMTWMSGAQTTGAGCYQGGWGYNFYDGSPDQSNTGYATLGIGSAAAAPPRGFGLSIPDGMLEGLSVFIDNVQTPNGGSAYLPCNPSQFLNILNTGKLLFEMALVGDDVEDQRVQNAIGFIEDYWMYSYNRMGWRDSYQAMYKMMMGLEAFNIETLNVGENNYSWFDSVSDFIIDHQNENGSFNILSSALGDESTNLRTAWALLTLEKVTPIKNEPPVCDANGPYSLECGSSMDVILDGTGSYDPDGDALTYQWAGSFDGGSAAGPTPEVSFPGLGIYVVDLEVSDGVATDQCSAMVNVEDTTPPSISLAVTPDQFWPPNHKMVPISLDITVSDTCDTDPQYSLHSITSNESDETNTYDPHYDETPGDGHTVNDIEVDNGGFISLRAERSGLGDGRIYTITYGVVDQSGNTATTSGTVTVPHNR